MRTNWKSQYVQLEAAHEALRASHDALTAQLAALTAERDSALGVAQRAQDREATLRSNERTVANRAALLLECKRLAQSGVPCFAQGDFVYHRLTRAILARVG